MEIWDAYDRDGNRLGVDLVRGEPIPKGMYHLVCEVIVRHRDGDFLLMRRDPNKPIQPGRWELTAGGSALKGEDALACIRRELYEETGLRCQDFAPVYTEVRDSGSIFKLYYAEADGDKDAIRLQDGETVEYRWVDRGLLEAMLDSEAVVRFMRRRYEACVKEGYIR